ncbi:MAG: signal peptidase II [Pseudomonadota bacterium]
MNIAAGTLRGNDSSVILKESKTLFKPFTQSGGRWLWLTLLVLLLDRVTKAMILHTIKLHDGIHITPYYNLMLTYNRGAAFSFLSNAKGWQSWLFSGIASVVSIVLLVWLFRLKRRQWWDSIAIAMILAGALGNLLDRFIYGHVIDFIQWHWHELYWPVFNIADASICIGSTMLILQAFFFKLTKKK